MLASRTRCFVARPERESSSQIPEAQHWSILVYELRVYTFGEGMGLASLKGLLGARKRKQSAFKRASPCGKRGAERGWKGRSQNDYPSYLCFITHHYTSDQTTLSYTRQKEYQRVGRREKPLLYSLEVCRIRIGHLLLSIIGP